MPLNVSDNPSRANTSAVGSPCNSAVSARRGLAAEGERVRHRYHLFEIRDAVEERAHQSGRREQLDRKAIGLDFLIDVPGCA